MSLIFGILLIFCTFILGTWFWAVTKAKGYVTGMLKTSNQLDDLVSHLFAAGFFDKKAEDVSETGGMWNVILSRGWGYDVAINMEIKGSMTSFTRPRNIFFVLILLVGVLEYLYLPLPFLAISVVLFVLLYLAPLPQSGTRRALKELSALSWLMFQFNKGNPEACKKFGETTSAVANLYAAIIQLH
jgi:hypothetical protein